MKTYNKMWEVVVSLMDDEIREQVHFELAPCTNEEFLVGYLRCDPAFEEVLDQIASDDEW